MNEDYLVQCWEECLQQSRYTAVSQEVDTFNRENRTKKRGVAIVPVSKQTWTISIDFNITLNSFFLR